MKNELIIKNRIIDAPIEDILKQLKSELTNGKLKYIDSKSNGWIRVTCPFHSDGLETNPSCGVYNGNDPKIEKGTSHCFTCGAYFPLYHFVAVCFDKDDNFGKKWLIDRFGGSQLSDSPNLSYINLDNKKEEYLDESILDNFQSFHPYMVQRKLDQSICNRFKVKYDPLTKCLVFPVWDDKNHLYMLTRRSVLNKTFIIDKDKEKPIYLLNYIKNQGIKEVIVCESQINSLTAWGWGYPAIATFGCNITPHQFKLLNKSNIDHYYLAFDGDEAGKKGTIKFIKNIRKDVFVDVIEIPKGKDINDLSEEEFNRLPTKNGISWLKDNV